MPAPAPPPASPREDEPRRGPAEHHSTDAPAEGADDTPPETDGSPRG